MVGRTPVRPGVPRPAQDGVDDAVLQNDASAVDLVEVGRVVDAYGVKGWIKIEPFAPAPDSVLLATKRWWFTPPERRGAAAVPPSQRARAATAPAGPQSVRIERARVHTNTVVAKPEGCEDRDAALALRGTVVSVARADFPRPAEGEFYWVDLVGCRVENRAGTVLGTIASVDDHGAHAVLTVIDPDHPDADGRPAERLIPFVEQFVGEVDIAARRVVADWELDW